ncbi:hypothetical protein CVT24_008498 [Panaeolus cyanescens]|uniref:Uncharacterized protein n=1 Tax=Panaeolus cyanescens TaxID=181874 RepID=A0A409WCS7_9AGAR|nr:hypothetical protein CVT24_008498 [Panaeolus cyanescens]
MNNEAYLDSSPPAIQEMLIPKDDSVPPASPTVVPSKEVRSGLEIDIPDVTMAEAERSVHSTFNPLYALMPLDGWFQADDKLFNLDLSRYAHESQILKDLYNQILQNREAIKRDRRVPPVKGSFPTDAIVLDGVDGKLVDRFLDFLKIQRRVISFLEWISTTVEVYTTEEIVGCISLARRWGLASVEEEFFKKLALPNQTPALRLYASVRFQKNYLDPHDLRRLVFTPLNDLKQRQDLSSLSYKVYRELTLARDAIMTQRANIAATFPTAPDACTTVHNHDTCEIMVDHLWQLHIATPLLTTTEGALESRESFINAVSSEDTIAQECRDHLVSDLTENADWEKRWNKEDVILRAFKGIIDKLTQGH